MLSADALQKNEEHEDAAHEKRNWVRLTSMCNNKCTFCLDTLAHNETMGPEDEIKFRIIDGRRKGATRLILSGGEPTIHPSYAKFIKYGRMAGYSKIQTVTNGRMFSYPAFLKRCLDAGLDEITFSIHGHNAKVHDALVGVQGAFDEEVEGLVNALEDGRPIVNIDVCLNKGNIKRLPQLLDRFIGLGVKEFDLLHLIPFGNAWDEKHRDRLVYDLEDAAPYIQAALKYSERPDIHIWFNRFPPPYLEGYEHLIQDPYKLNDEARGRYEEYELWLTRNRPLSCREEERCSRCYMEPFCDKVQSTMEAIEADAFDAFRVDLRALSNDDEAPEPPAVYDAFWLRANSWVDVAAFWRKHARVFGAWAEHIVEVDEWGGFEELSEEFRDALSEVRVQGRGALEAALKELPEDVRLVVVLNHQTMSALEELGALNVRPDLQFTLQRYHKASQALSEGGDLRTFFEAFGTSMATEDIPPCLGGQNTVTLRRVLDASILRSEEPREQTLTPGDTGGRGSILKILDDLSIGDPAKASHIEELQRLGNLSVPVEKGVMDIFGFSNNYIGEHFSTKSRRCRSCKFNKTCSGLPINHVRAFGYQLMAPIEE